MPPPRPDALVIIPTYNERQNLALIAPRVLASYGYAMDYPVQRYLRAVRFTLIGGATSEILKLIIAKELTA